MEMYSSWRVGSSQPSMCRLKQSKYSVGRKGFDERQRQKILSMQGVSKEVQFFEAVHASSECEGQRELYILLWKGFL